MITAISLNPSIDRTVSIDHFTYGGMNRVVEKRQEGSGKGINVAIAAKRIGAETSTIGLMYELNSAPVTTRLENEDIPYEFVWCEGEVRTNTKILDLSCSKVTEVNESGTKVSSERLTQLKKLICDWADRSDIMVFTGSVPKGCGVDIYRELIAGAGSGVRCILDAEGELMSRGLSSQPFLVKPNQYELEIFCQKELHTKEEIVAAARLLIDRGAQNVLVSMGGDGAIWTDGSNAFFAPNLPVKISSTVGAGDSMIGAVCAALEKGLPSDEVFRYGVAGGNAGVMTDGTDLIRASDFEELLPKVTLEKID